MAIPVSVWTWLFLVPLIPSVIVAMFTLYHLLTDRTLRIALNNHVIILLLCCGIIMSLTDIVWYIVYFRTGTVVSSTPAFCFAWIMMDSAGYISIQILMAWASIERHILVFYPHWFGTKRKCFFFHYIPLVVCILYPTTFYIVVFIIIPCDVPFTYIYYTCGRYACILQFPWIGLWDSILHYIMSAFLTVIFSVALFIRVLYTRYRIRGRIEWRNYQKLTMQLLPISVLYITLQLPPMILYCAYTAGLNYSIGSGYYYDGLNFTYWVILFTPFASAMSLPNLSKKCSKMIFFWRKRRDIHPKTTGMSHSTLAPTNTAVATVG